MKLFILLLAPAVAFADGDPARGEKRFEECAACHSLESGASSGAVKDVEGRARLVFSLPSCNAAPPRENYRM